MRPRLALTAAVATTLLIATACSSGDESTDTASDGDVLGSVETMFGGVDVPHPDDGELTVVALGYSDAEMALALGIQPAAVFDWQGFGEENKGVGPWATADFGDVTPTVIPNTAQELNYEQIQGLNPDLILNVRSDNDEATYNRLSQIAPTVYGPEGTGAYATAWDVQMQSIASAVGRSDQGDEIISGVRAQIEDAARQNPDFAGNTISSGTKFGDAYGAYLAGDNRFDILADLGFEQNPPILELPASGYFANISAENIGALDANVSIFLPIGFSLAETTADPLIASLTSVQNDRAVFIDPDSELAGAWGAGSVLSIPVVLETLVPQLQTAVGNLA